jgi:hypothetical protein
VRWPQKWLAAERHHSTCYAGPSYLGKIEAYGQGWGRPQIDATLSNPSRKMLCR